MLTPKQLQLLTFIAISQKQGLAAPSYTEMAAAIGLRAKSGINRLILALEERGYIERLPHKARSVRIIDFSFEADCKPSNEPFSSKEYLIPFLGKVSDLSKYIAPYCIRRERS